MLVCKHSGCYVINQCSFFRIAAVGSELRDTALASGIPHGLCKQVISAELNSVVVDMLTSLKLFQDRVAAKNATEVRQKCVWDEGSSRLGDCNI